MTKIKLYTKEDIDEFKWPKNQKYKKEYILPLIKKEVSQFIANVETEVALLEVDNSLFPVTINNEEYTSSYVCSPYNAFVIYSKEELSKLNNRPLEALINIFITMLSKFLKSAQINKVVIINNWLLSTNLYTAWDGRNIKNITEYLLKKFPHHIIMYRSLNNKTNSMLMKKYHQNGYIFIPSRQIYLYDKKTNHYYKKYDTKRDFNLLKTTKYKVVQHDEITSDDYARITQLYNKLYLEKHSYHNPQFTKELIALWHQKKLMVMQGLRNNQGILDGIIGCFEFNNVMATPLVGYDTSLSQSLGLYRMLTALVLKRAYIQNITFNASSGASNFKRLRGGVPEIEYSAIYNKHLSQHRIVVLKILAWMLNNIGVPLIQKFKL